MRTQIQTTITPLFSRNWMVEKILLFKKEAMVRQLLIDMNLFCEETERLLNVRLRFVLTLSFHCRAAAKILPFMWFLGVGGF